MTRRKADAVQLIAGLASWRTSFDTNTHLVGGFRRVDKYSTNSKKDGKCM